MASSQNALITNVWFVHLSPENTVSENSLLNYDSLLITSPEDDLDRSTVSTYLSKYVETLKLQKEVNAAFDSETSLVCLPEANNQLRRLVYSPVGPLDRDYDDVRRFADAASKGVKRALKSGAKRLILIIPEENTKFKYFQLASILGAFEPLYVPFEIREDIPIKLHKVEKFGVGSLSGAFNPYVLKLASAIESGRVVCRDIGGSDPERMAAPNVAHYVEKVFTDTCIKVDVIDDDEVLQQEYPLLAAVNRAAKGISRHQARVIYLTYEPEGPYKTTLVLVGKGVTYDTGGADVKAGGIMAGMHRDKCGAAAVAGFFQVLSVLKPQGIKVLGAMAMVRNSIGPDCYVSDEIITSRAGVRVRVGNTDAEGRMAMADLLCYMKEKVLHENDPHLFTIATLTGHACLAVGDGYSIVMANGPAKKSNVGINLQQAGEQIGDMFEISTLRREDYEFHKGKSEYEDLIQCNNQMSTRTERGHQTPAAFLIMSSGLDKHGVDSEKPLKYCHIDIAASSGPFPGIPSGAPIPALTKCFVLG